MSTEMLFKTAAKHKFRFPFRGQITTEDLFDLSLTNLDNIFKTLNAESKKSEEESLLNTKSVEDEELDLKIEIVKCVVSEKLAEKKAREQAAEKKALKQKLLAIKAKRENEAMENMSEEEINKMLAELD